MRKHRRAPDEISISELEHNHRGAIVMLALIAIALGSWIAMLILMIFSRAIADPFLLAAMTVDLGTICFCCASLFSRSLFYAPFVMGVTSCVCILYTMMTFYIRAKDDLVFILSIVNNLAMLGLWTSYASSYKSTPARWLHPFIPPPKDEDLEMAVITVSPAIAHSPSPSPSPSPIPMEEAPVTKPSIISSRPISPIHLPQPIATAPLTKP